MNEPRPFGVLAGMALLVVAGVALVATGIGAVPGVALIAYGLVYPLFETWDVIWDRVERFTDWWEEGR